MKVFADDQTIANKVIKCHKEGKMKLEKYRTIEYLLDKLAGGTECHCTIFRMIPGMSPDTARRRLNDWRLLFENQGYEVMVLYTQGWTCHKTAHIWSFTRPFLKFLQKQLRAAEKLEKQNAKVKHEN